jgi:hypothetical protein
VLDGRKGGRRDGKAKGRERRRMRGRMVPARGRRMQNCAAV